MARVFVLLALLVVTAVVAVEGSAQETPQPPPRDAAASRGGSATLTGRVTAAADGAPLPRATVVLHGPGDTSRTAETDETGRYQFTGLERGSYFVGVQRRGYVQPKGAQGVDIREGDAARLDLALERQGSISGRVFDEAGEPIADVRVEAMRLHRNAPLEGPLRSRDTDDEGRYRLFGLPPGRYVVRADPATLRVASPPGPDTTFDYVTVFAPGVGDSASAQVVVVGATRDFAGIDVHLSRQRTYRVSGTVLDSRGRPPRNAFITYSHEVEGGARTATGAEIKSDGAFTLEGLTSGEYRLEVGYSWGDPSGEEADRDTEYARQTIGVFDNIEDLAVVTRPTATVSGEIVFEGAPAAFAMPPDLRIGVIAPEKGGGSSTSPSMAVANGDRRFTLRRVAGRCVVVQMSRVPGWWLQRVTYRGEEVTDLPTEFQSSAPGAVDLLVVFTNRAARVNGTVTDAAGRPVPRAWVFGFADPRVPGVDSRSADRMTVADEHGVFALPGLVAEHYAIAAVEPNEEGPSQQIFERVLPLATSMGITRGETRTLDLKVTPLPAP